MNGAPHSSSRPTSKIVTIAGCCILAAALASRWKRSRYAERTRLPTPCGDTIVLTATMRSSSGSRALVDDAHRARPIVFDDLVATDGLAALAGVDLHAGRRDARRPRHRARPSESAVLGLLAHRARPNVTRTIPAHVYSPGSRSAADRPRSVAPAGTEAVTHALPPITAPLPITVSPPRIVAPA